MAISVAPPDVIRVVASASQVTDGGMVEFHGDIGAAESFCGAEYGRHLLGFRTGDCRRETDQRELAEGVADFPGVTGSAAVVGFVSSPVVFFEPIGTGVNQGGEIAVGGSRAGFEDRGL